MVTGEGRRVVVFTGRYESATVVEDVEAVVAAFPSWRILVVQETPPSDDRRRLRVAFRRLRAEPLAFPLAVVRRRLMSHGTRKGGSRVSLPATLSDVRAPNLEYVRCERLHDAATLDRVAAWRPWLGLSIAAPILMSALFRIPKAGTINVHKSLLPEYRGMPPGFWELHDNADTSGVSVHWIDEGLDTGRLILQEAVPVPAFTTPLGLGHLLDVVGTRTLIRALTLLDRGLIAGRPQGESHTPTRSRPPEGVRRRVERDRAQRRRPASRSAGMRVVKELASAAYLAVVAAPRGMVRRARRRPVTTVLLYHRVSDEFLDGVTVGVEQFDRQLAALKRHYDVVDPEALFETDTRSGKRRRIVITFDDGYRDNYLAARLLRRHGLSAAFFVSTRIIGTERGFPHDWKRLGRTVPALDWDEIREMSAWGFPIGNHTADHANLGEVPLEEAESQIRTATRDLEDRCPASAARWLAYPYGTPEAMPAALRERLPAIGIEVCFSAYGGENGPRVDHWNVVRQGVDHGMTQRRLRAAIEGWHIGRGGD